MRHKKDNYIKRLADIEERQDIPHFFIWLRKTRKLSQNDLAKLCGFKSKEASHLQTARQVFPYKTLRKVYNEVLSPAEKTYFLECLKGHVRLLLESPDDETFRDIVKVKTDKS